MYTVWHNVCKNNYSHIVVCTNNYSHIVVYENNCSHIVRKTQCLTTFFTIEKDSHLLPKATIAVDSRRA